MDSDLAWVNGKSGRQSGRYADAFQRFIISETIYHFTILAYIMHEIWPIGSQEYHRNCYHQMSDFKAKIHEIRFFLLYGVPLHTPVGGAYRAPHSPDP